MTDEYKGKSKLSISIQHGNMPRISGAHNFLALPFMVAGFKKWKLKKCYLNQHHEFTKLSKAAAKNLNVSGTLKKQWVRKLWEHE